MSEFDNDLRANTFENAGARTYLIFVFTVGIYLDK